MSRNAYRDGERTFAPDEVRRVLRRAAELHRGDRERGRTHTREEIERIARDVGIGPEALRRAMAGEEPRPTVPWSISGSPATVVVTREVGGDEEAVARALRGKLGAGPRVMVENGVLRVEEGQGRMRRVTIEVAALMGGIGMLVVVALTAAIHGRAVPLVLAIWITMMVFVARAMVARRFRAREEELRLAVEDVVERFAPAWPRAADLRARVAPPSEAHDEIEEEEDAAAPRKTVRVDRA